MVEIGLEGVPPGAPSAGVRLAAPSRSDRGGSLLLAAGNGSTIRFNLFALESQYLQNLGPLRLSSGRSLHRPTTGVDCHVGFHERDPHTAHDFDERERVARRWGVWHHKARIPAFCELAYQTRHNRARPMSRGILALCPRCNEWEQRVVDSGAHVARERRSEPERGHSTRALAEQTPQRLEARRHSALSAALYDFGISFTDFVTTSGIWEGTFTAKLLLISHLSRKSAINIKLLPSGHPNKKSVSFNARRNLVWEPVQHVLGTPNRGIDHAALQCT